MFFVASKILGLIVEPANFLILLGLVGLGVMRGRFARVGRTLTATVILLLAFAAFSPISSLILRPLEDRFPQPSPEMPSPVGIVVLGGAMDEDLSESRGQPTLTEAAGRLTAGVALARRYPKARLVFTGGSANVRQEGFDEARGVHELWSALGVPEAQMTFESRSRNTFENAVLTRALVHPAPGETWLLVTSASHMPRSMGIFRRTGWPIVAYPVDYRTFGDARDFKINLNAADAFRRLETGLHEWVGLVAYRLTGKTDALFPGP